MGAKLEHFAPTAVFMFEIVEQMGGVPVNQYSAA